jgi:UDP-3-O-[3-hydroxymyristoyl] glucosamine N-acyltransferase
VAAHTLADIAARTGGRLFGDARCAITGVAGIREAGPGDIAFVANPRYVRDLASTAASAVIVSEDVAVPDGLSGIVHADPSLAFAQVVEMLFPPPARPKPGVHPGAAVDATARLGADVSIGPFVVVEAGARIGDRTVLAPFVYVGAEAAVGADCLLYPHVSVRERCVLGDRVIVHCGAVLGSDGYGYVQIGTRHQKIPQVGIVEIGDDVEIGANVCVDRARFGKTVIGRGTKIDNLVQIAHNVRIGQDSLVIAQAGISGSTEIGDNVVLAGQAGLVGHISVGDGAIVTAQAGVTKSVPAGQTVAGMPARPFAEFMRGQAAQAKMADWARTVRALERRVAQLEEALRRSGRAPKAGG